MITVYRAMLHEESVYGPDALEFRPERYKDSDLPFPEIVFGFGRRQCPGTSNFGPIMELLSLKLTASSHTAGRHLARESIWLAIVSVLATLDISQAKDEQGNSIEPVDGQVSGIVP